MSLKRKRGLDGRSPLKRQPTGSLSRKPHRGVALGKRARGRDQNVQLPFVPPEDWHEPTERGGAEFRLIVQPAGKGYRHVVTPSEVRQRLAALPEEFLEPLEVVQLSQLTRKKQSFPCYGMQWGATIYLYPVEECLEERFVHPPKPQERNEARMYGGRWMQTGAQWRLVWTEQAIRDFYLNNILIHELGHLLDERNTGYADRERFAEWFAVHYGYRHSTTRRHRHRRRRVVRRHHAQ